MAPQPQPRQGSLFGSDLAPEAGPNGPPPPDGLPLLQHQLEAWQQRLAQFQAPLFAAAAAGGEGPGQGQLWSAAAAGPLAGDQPGDPQQLAAGLDPLALAAQHLQFWRWPSAPHEGAALYFVVDRPAHLPGALLLYVGETGRADRRWKGEHDCKSYLAAYGEALQRAGLSSQLTIRFWSDAPAAVRPRRALEQALIRHWLPPFNKETRARWATPFTADPD